MTEKAANQRGRKPKSPPQMHTPAPLNDYLASGVDYRAFFENTGTAMMILDADTTILLINHEFERLSGRQREEVEGRISWTGLIHPEDVDRMKQYHRDRRVDESAAPRNYSFRLFHKGGTLRTVWATVSMLTGTNRSIVSLIDITELKEIESALRDSETRYRLIFENARDVMFTADETGCFTSVNHSFVELTGYSPEELIGANFSKIVSPEYHETVRNRLQEKIANVSPASVYEFEIVRKDGERRTVELSSLAITRDGLPVGVQGIARDITERKFAEQALQDSQNRLQMLLDSISCAVMVIDAETKQIIDVNQAARQMIGLPNQQIVGRLCHQFVCPSESGNCPVLDKGLMLDNSERTLLRLGKEALPILKSVRAISLDGRNYLLESFVDISERMKAEEALRESEQRFRNLFENANDIVFLLDLNFRFQTINKAGEWILGHNRSDLQGHSMFDLVPDKLADAARTNLVSQLEGNYFGRALEISVIAKNGKVISLETSLQYIYKGDQPIGMQGIARDVSDRKDMEAQLRYTSLHDSLTGLPNRAFFEESMRRIEKGRYVSAGLIVCDVDGLKLVNDTMGHSFGDRLLQETARVLNSCFRESDVIARVGGDEFAALIPDASEPVLEEVSRRIRNAIDQYNAGNPPVPLSLSQGWAVQSKSLLTMNGLFSEADNNMYKEKLQNSGAARQAIMRALVRDLVALDFVNQGHTRRLQQLLISTAALLQWPVTQNAELQNLAKYHDIGKVVVDRGILFKSQPLSPEERLELRRHAEAGYRIACSIPRLAPISDLILKHHEYWDGHGYPMGLAGENIPPQCRLFAVCDAWDAMTSCRPYRNREFSVQEARVELQVKAGTQFDPMMVEAVLAALEKGLSEIDCHEESPSSPDRLMPM